MTEPLLYETPNEACHHPRWKTIEQYDITRKDPMWQSKVTVGRIWVQQCERCGLIRTERYDVTEAK